MPSTGGCNLIYGVSNNTNSWWKIRHANFLVAQPKDRRYSVDKTYLKMIRSWLTIISIFHVGLFANARDYFGIDK